MFFLRLLGVFLILILGPWSTTGGFAEEDEQQVDDANSGENAPKTKTVEKDFPRVPAGIPVLGEIFWPESQAHCRFALQDNVASSKRPNGERYVLLTEQVGDGHVTAERAYMRIDGLLRELFFLTANRNEGGEQLLYRTQEHKPVLVTLDLENPERTKKETRYAGLLTLDRDGESVQVSIAGVCDPVAANRYAKS